MKTEKDTSSEGFDSPSFEEVWTVLSKVDVTAQKKQLPDSNITYLSWTWAWDELMKHYPYATYSFDEDQWDHLGYCTVSCTIRIGHLERSMWLPVMGGYSHKAVKNPDARGRSDTRMRCLVKAMAMFGLGHYIYNGEDFPRKEDDEEMEQQEQDEKLPPFGDGKRQIESEADAKKASEQFANEFRNAASSEQIKALYTANPNTFQALERGYPSHFAVMMQEAQAKIAALNAAQ